MAISRFAGRRSRGGGPSPIFRYTIDASVFVNSFNMQESGHAASLEFLQAVRRAGDPVIVPNLVIVEVASAVARAHRDANAGVQYAAVVAALPHIVFLSLSSSLARSAAEIAATCRVRGSDAIYLTVADRYATTLVSRDQEQIARGSRIATCQTPEQALGHFGG